MPLSKLCPAGPYRVTSRITSKYARMWVWIAVSESSSAPSLAPTPA